MKRLPDAGPYLERVFAPMVALGDRTGPSLFQLPTRMSLDLYGRVGRLDQLPFTATR